ncbi:MAG: hypothetical protein E7260_08905 [Lachnospiraceae bacterium]|nr:hypothetical protein [Lachnospiraceae bacterium]
MKKKISYILFITFIIFSVSCSPKPVETPDASPSPTKALSPAPSAYDGPAIDYMQLSVSNSENGEYISISAYNNGFNQAYVEYVGEYKKAANFDLSVLTSLAEQVKNSGVEAIHDHHVYETGETYANMYISFTDGSQIFADYSGLVPEEFLTYYQILENYFLTLVADLPIYVPRPVVMGEVNELTLTELMNIMENTGLEYLDGFSIYEVPMDDAFDTEMGLSHHKTIKSGTMCGPVMSGSAFSLAVAVLEKDADITSVANNFATNIRWNRWVCVSASDALIAQKDNMVLCLVSYGDMYKKTAAAIRALGWTEVKTLGAPDYN